MVNLLTMLPVIGRVTTRNDEKHGIMAAVYSVFIVENTVGFRKIVNMIRLLTGVQVIREEP